MCEEIDNSVFLERNKWICKSCDFNTVVLNYNLYGL